MCVTVAIFPKGGRFPKTGERGVTIPLSCDKSALVVVADLTRYPVGKETGWGKIVTCPLCRRRGVRSWSGDTTVITHLVKQYQSTVNGEGLRWEYVRQCRWTMSAQKANKLEVK